VQFGNLVFATQKNANLQVYDLSSPATGFTDCAGSPPPASYISVVGRFLVLSGLLSQPYPHSMVWIERTYDMDERR
jgi:hypothetical protein